MKAVRRWWIRTWNFARNRRQAERLREEMREHVALQAEEYLRAGVPPEEARRRARLRFGSMEAVGERYHAEEGLPLLEEIAGDVRFGIRTLRKSLGFTVVATLSFALAIGAGTLIFSIARQLLFTPLAVAHPEALRLLTWTGNEQHLAVRKVFDGFAPLEGGQVASTSFSYAAWQELRAHGSVLSELFAFHSTGMNLTVDDETERVAADEVSGNYYAALGVHAQAGRLLQPEDDAPSSQPAVVISDAVWAGRLGVRRRRSDAGSS